MTEAVETKNRSIKGMYKPATHKLEEVVHPIPSVPGIPPRKLLVFYPQPSVEAAHHKELL